MSNPGDAAIVDRAITTRRSIRAFLDTPVSREIVEEIGGGVAVLTGTLTRWAAVGLAGNLGRENGHQIAVGVPGGQRLVEDARAFLILGALREMRL